jgi:hypothetical protein
MRTIEKIPIMARPANTTSPSAAASLQRPSPASKRQWQLWPEPEQLFAAAMAAAGEQL